MLIIELLLKEKNIILEYDPTNNFIIANWTGYQTGDSIYYGYTKIMEYARKYKAKKVLNDNSSVTGIWSCAARWVGKEWFPQMIEEGLTNFAWVYSSSVFSRLSTNETLNHIIKKDVVMTFEDRASAENWLKTIQG